MCLQLIKEAINDPWVYDTWFAPIRCESYDEQANAVVLQVPSQYVREYLEHYCLRILKQALEAAFKPGVRLQYRIAADASFSMVANYLRRQGFRADQPRPHIACPDAGERLHDGLKYYLGDNYRWLPAYERIAEWLTDNRGRGLLCIGTPGLGKTLICQRILPVILGRNIPSVTAQEMNDRIDTLLKERCVIIDDLGKEDVEVKNYGNRRTPFFELCDAAERNGNLLIITTNLSTTPVTDPRYPDSIQHRYGPEVLDRLRAITRAVLFTGDSLRH